MTGKTSGGHREDRRRFPRLATSLLVRLQTGDGQQVPCRVLDASVSGVRLDGDAVVVPVGTEVTLIMPGAVHFGGRIIRRQGSVIGIEFSHAPERVAEMISALLPNLGAEPDLRKAP